MSDAVAVPMVRTMINGRWPLLLPEHRALRPEWPWWEATRLAAMATVIGPGSVVWDVGAEEGDFPALWASWGAGVVLAEPNPKVWPNIRAIFEGNGFEPRACWPGFFGDSHSHQISEYHGRAAWPECAFGPVIGDHGFCQLGERPDIPMTTVDLLARFAPPPTVLTMDVEGSELHVLRGAAATLTEHRPDVFVSIHPEFMAHHYGVPDGVAAVRGFMADVGYPLDDHRFLCIDHEHHWWFPR